MSANPHGKRRCGPRKLNDTTFLFHASEALLSAARTKAEGDGVSLAHACRRGLQLYLREAVTAQSGATPTIGLEIAVEG